MAPAMTASHSAPPAATPRLLLVDCDPGLRFTVGDYFRRVGARVDEAATVWEAEAWLARGAYDAVITDLQLSASVEADGVALARQIRTVAPATAVCILTLPREPRLMAAAESVASVVLTRPRKLADLAQIVFALLHDPVAPEFTSTGRES
jgi:DNA-binding response OmpR family regulator